jgi:hypothetical protein
VPGRHQWNQEPRFHGTATSWKRENNQRDIEKDHRAGVRKESKLDVQRATKINGPDLVEGSTSSKKEKETTGRAEAGNLETPAPNR